MKRLLNFNLKTPMKAYQFQAYISGIILAETNEKMLYWLATHSLNLKFSGGNLYVNYAGDCPVLFKDIQYSADDCFYRGQIDLPLSILVKKNKQIINQILSMINEGYFVHGYYDEYYVNNRQFFNKQSFIHDYLIIGYDDERSIFYIAGYNENWIFSIIEISFENFMKALYNRKDHYSSAINFYKLKPHFEYKISSNFLHRSLSELIYSTSYSMYSILDKNACYGKEALIKFISNIYNSGDNLRDVQNIRAFTEHIYFLSIVLKKYTITNTLLNNSIVNDYLLLSENISIIINQATKYYLCNNHEVAKKNIKNIIELFEKELNLLDIINSLFDKNYDLLNIIK